MNTTHVASELSIKLARQLCFNPWKDSISLNTATKLFAQFATALEAAGGVVYHPYDSRFDSQVLGSIAAAAAER